MQDRISENPGRVLITPENGPAYYATMTRADNPTQNGTPLNKASLLKDATAALFGLGADAVPDDALNSIKTLIDGANANANAKAQIATGSYTGTGTYGIGNKNSLTFDFEPKFVVVMYFSDFAIFIKDAHACASVVSGISSYLRTTWDGNTLSWYAENNISGQLNQKWVYRYIAIG